MTIPLEPPAPAPTPSPQPQPQPQSKPRVDISKESRKKFMAKKKESRVSKDRDSLPPKKPDNRGANGWQSVNFENAKLDIYYQAQGICSSADDYAALLACLRSGLPTTFRIASCRGNTAELLARMQLTLSQFPPSGIITYDGEDILRPTPMPWFPGGLAWHFNCSRSALRRCPELKPFHRFLVAETEIVCLFLPLSFYFGEVDCR